MNKITFITVFSGYEPKKRYCKQVDTISRTIQDAVVDVPGLLKQFNGRLDDLFRNLNNGLVFESQIGVFVDELNSEELAQFNKMQSEKAQRELEEKTQSELFEKWKAEIANKVMQDRQEKSAPVSE